MVHLRRLNFTRRRVLWTAVVIDAVTLLIFTGWVGFGHAVRGVAAAAPADAAVVNPHVTVAGSPQFVLCGTTDDLGRAWFGTQDQGVWCDSPSGWTQFTTVDGLGENACPAMAFDHAGRLWVGHRSAGISIYDGTSWRNYDAVAGPGGAHVYAIACCPRDGDVWMSTSAGLTRYAPATDSWTTYDRRIGPAAEPASAIAFDSAGTMFVALQTDGIATATAAGNYAHWTHTPGPRDMPAVAAGAGLPSALVNALLVTRNGVVYAGTCHGLAASTDHGVTWSYLRGHDWPLYAAQRDVGLPKKLENPFLPALAEDWITGLAQDASSAIWVGFHHDGVQCYAGDFRQPVFREGGSATAIVPLSGGGCLAGTFSGSVVRCGSTDVSLPAAPPPSSPSPRASLAFPLPAATPTAAQLTALLQVAQDLPPGSPGVDALDDDCQTRGDWIGRYGSRFADLLGHRLVTAEPGYRLGVTTGPFLKRDVWQFENRTVATPLRADALLDPTTGQRTLSNLNDGAFRGAYSRWQQGPDLYLAVTLPAGVHRVSLYLQNFEGSEREFRGRDLVIEARYTPGGVPDRPPFAAETAARLQPTDATDAELAPVLARGRVQQYATGVYKRFLTRGAGTFWFKIMRNHSDTDAVEGVFVDRLDAPEFGMGPMRPPAGTDDLKAADLRGDAARLWAALDAAVGRAGYADLQAPARIAAYRAAVAAGTDPNTLARWRWQLPAWAIEDHAGFTRYADNLALTQTVQTR